jgi:hypothetical protein
MTRHEKRVELAEYGLAPCVAARTDLSDDEMQRFREWREIGLCPAVALSAAQRSGA